MKFFKMLFGKPKWNVKTKREIDPDIAFSCKCAQRNALDCVDLSFDFSPPEIADAAFVSFIKEGVTYGRGTILDETDLLTLRGILDEALFRRGYPRPTYKNVSGKE